MFTPNLNNPVQMEKFVKDIVRETLEEWFITQ